MSIINKFTGGIVNEVSTGLDNLFTSDEERLQARNAFAAINEKIVAGGNELAAKINQAITDRHKADMMSDSWLSKNVRPLALVIMTTFTLLFLMFVQPETPVELSTYEVKLGLLTSLDLLIFGFYFGSRGVEKVVASVAAVMKKKPKKEELDDDEDW